MPDNAPTESSRRTSWSYRSLWACIIVFVLYPFSVGPVMLLADQGVLPEVVFVIYAPLDSLCNNSAIAEAFFDWYLDLWSI